MNKWQQIGGALLLTGALGGGCNRQPSDLALQEAGVNPHVATVDKLVGKMESEVHRVCNFDDLYSENTYSIATSEQKTFWLKSQSDLVHAIENMSSQKSNVTIFGGSSWEKGKEHKRYDLNIALTSPISVQGREYNHVYLQAQNVPGLTSVFLDDAQESDSKLLFLHRIVSRTTNDVCLSSIHYETDLSTGQNVTFEQRDYELVINTALKELR